MARKKKKVNKIKKVAFNLLKPFIPFVIIVLAAFFCICTVIDAVFIQEVQASDSSMSEVELNVKNLCIEKAEYLNTCNNYIDGQATNYLVDMDDRETDKLIEWSHLYAIMAFHNMTDNSKLDENLLNKIAKEFESTFKYEQNIITIETTTTDSDGNEIVSTQEEISYVLIESDTIIGHYTYNYQEQTIKNGNTKTTSKVFVSEQLVGEKYERLKKYLKENLHVGEDELNTDAQVVIQAANGYSEGKENVEWLKESSIASTNIIADGESLVPTGMFIWPIPGYTTITSHFGMRTHPITGVYKLHTGTDVSAPIRSKFCCNGRWNCYISIL